MTGSLRLCGFQGCCQHADKQLACELAQYGITVSALGPTFIKTDINAKLLADPGFREPLIKRIPVGRIGEFKDLMGLMLLCCL